MGRRMRELSVIGGLAALVVGFGNGCGGAVPASRYYTIDYDVKPVETARPVDVVLGVEPFSTQPLYRDRRIAHRASEHEVVYYPYSYWAASPGELVADRVAAHIRQTRVIRGVEEAPYATSPDWVLSGHVEQFEEVVHGGQAAARLGLTIRIESLTERRILREEEIAIEKPLSGRSPEEVAAAMSAAVREAGDRVVAIIRELASQPQVAPETESQGQ